MPELPEVETVRRGITPHVIGRQIEQVIVRDRRLRWPVDDALTATVSHQTVVETARRGKYLIIALASGDRLLIHLGMSGRLRVLVTGAPPSKHDHVDFQLSGRVLLRFHDPRRFGAVLLWPAGALSHPLLDHLGPEPFDDRFDGRYLFNRSRGRQSAVKSFLMDGETVVGCGNIYAAESLFRAGIRPDRPAGSLSLGAYRRLADAVRCVLLAAIEQGGTTLRDFAGANGEAGYFQQALFVYGREGEACRRCQTPVAGKRIGQRASAYCPRCQR